MTDSMNVAIYARVSSEHQAEARTIESQIAALLERVAGDGHLLSDEMQFIDDGYSGATLIRPGLERLRDVAAGGALDRVYVHSPDRLARKYAYQVLLIDEFERNGVEVAFLNRELGAVQRTSCSYKYKGWSPSMSAPRSSNDTEEESDTRRRAARSMYYRVRLTATAT